MTQMQDEVRFVRPGWLLFVLAVFLATRGYIFFVLEPQMTDVGSPYFVNAIRVVDNHEVPYGDTLQIEYPPVAWWTIYAPRLLDGRRITNPRDAQQVDPIFKSYRAGFRGLMLLADLGSFILLALIVWQSHPRLLIWATLLYTVATAVLGHMLYDRLDVGLLFLLLGWAFCWTRSLNESGRTIPWTTAAYAILGLSISFKIVPVIAVPFLLLADWRAPRRAVRLPLELLALAAAALVPFAIQYSISGSGVFALFRYHGEREIQIESLYSTFMMIAYAFGVTAFVSHAHGAYELAGNLAHAMKVTSTVVLAGFLGLLGLLAILRSTRYSRRDAYCFACYAIAGAVILSNVLSPQYFIWAIPLLILLATELFSERRTALWIFTLLCLTVVGLTTWIFPYHYMSTPEFTGGLIPLPSDVGRLSAPICIVLGLRNLLYLGIVVWMGTELFRRSENKPVQQPARVSPAPVVLSKKNPPGAFVR